MELVNVGYLTIPVIRVVSKQAIRTFFSILLAELESLFQKTNTRRKLTVSLNEFTVKFSLK